MAPLTDATRFERRSDRAQLFLVAAVVLAVVLVALALLLNTMIYTGNVASRDASGGVDKAATYEAAAADAGERLLANASEADGDYGPKEEDFRNGMAVWANASGTHASVRGLAATLDGVDTTRGTRVTQDPGSGETFTPHSNTSANWTVVSQGRLREYTVTGSPSASISDVIFGGNLSESFYVVFDGTETYTAHVYVDGTETCLTVLDGSRDPVDGAESVCVSDGNVTVDFVAGTVAPADDPDDVRRFNTTFFEAVGPDHAVEYRNGDEITGGYRFVVDRERSSVVGGNQKFATDPTETPYAARVLYGGRYDISTRSTGLRYETDVRVAPGEVDYGDA